MFAHNLLIERTLSAVTNPLWMILTKPSKTRIARFVGSAVSTIMFSYAKPQCALSWRRVTRPLLICDIVICTSSLYFQTKE
jgi:hypothetical protein